MEINLSFGSLKEHNEYIEATYKSLYPTAKAEPVSILEQTAKEVARGRTFRKAKAKREPWTTYQIRLVRDYYPTTSSRKIAQLLGRSTGAVSQLVHKLRKAGDIAAKRQVNRKVVTTHTA